MFIFLNKAHVIQENIFLSKSFFSKRNYFIFSYFKFVDYSYFSKSSLTTERTRELLCAKVDVAQHISCERTHAEMG